MRKLSVVPVLLAAVLVTACGSSDSGEADGSVEQGPEAGTLEAIVEALECQEDDTTGDGVGQVLYSCGYSDRDDVSAIYVYAWDKEEDARSFAEGRVDFRADEERPRGLAWNENWVLDTHSVAAMEVAEEQGATVTIPAVGE